MSLVNANFVVFTSVCLLGTICDGISLLFLRNVPTYVRPCRFNSVISSMEENQLSPVMFLFELKIGVTSSYTFNVGIANFLGFGTLFFPQ